MLKRIWNYLRTLVFYTLGLKYTVFIRPEQIGTWPHLIGYFLIVLAIFDTILIVKYFIKQKRRIGVE
jgi:hypothetical protein